MSHKLTARIASSYPVASLIGSSVEIQRVEMVRPLGSQVDQLALMVSIDGVAIEYPMDPKHLSAWAGSMAFESTQRAQMLMLMWHLDQIELPYHCTDLRGQVVLAVGSLPQAAEFLRRLFKDYPFKDSLDNDARLKVGALFQYPVKNRLDLEPIEVCFSKCNDLKSVLGGFWVTARVSAEAPVSGVVGSEKSGEVLAGKSSIAAYCLQHTEATEKFDSFVVGIDDDLGLVRDRIHRLLQEGFEIEMLFLPPWAINPIDAQNSKRKANGLRRLNGVLLHSASSVSATSEKSISGGSGDGQNGWAPFDALAWARSEHWEGRPMMHNTQTSMDVRLDQCKGGVK